MDGSGEKETLEVTLTREWVQQLASRMAEEGINEIVLSKKGEEGRLILKEVEMVRRVKPFALNPRDKAGNGHSSSTEPVRIGSVIS